VIARNLRGAAPYPAEVTTRDGGKGGDPRQAVCIRCGRPFAAGGHCPHCADLHVLVSPHEDRDGTPAEWSFEIWSDQQGEGGPVFAVRGFATPAEALGRAHELVRRYVEQRSRRAP
jgi:hypothetical protein